MEFKRISIYFGVREGKSGYLNIIDLERLREFTESYKKFKLLRLS